MNTFGKIFTLTTFGESHGKAIGGIIDGVPSGFKIDTEILKEDMTRRRPGDSGYTSPRKESDDVELLSGIDSEGNTLGSPIGFIIRNNDYHTSDYSNYENHFRPNHADFTYYTKYGIHPQPGGGRSSARETACRVVGGSIARMIISEFGIEITAYLSSVGSIGIPELYPRIRREDITKEYYFCPDHNTATRIKEYLKEFQNLGDSIGGTVSCIIRGVPEGLGEPVFGKLQSALAAGIMSINAAKSFEYGLGTEAAETAGSKCKESYSKNDGKIVITSTLSGGISGGISNGTDIFFTTSFKPTPTLGIPIEMTDINGDKSIVNPKGRHDTCVAIRAVPVVEAMAALVIADMMRINGILTNRK